MTQIEPEQPRIAPRPRLGKAAEAAGADDVSGTQPSHGLGIEELPPPPTPKKPRSFAVDVAPALVAFGAFILLWSAFRTFWLDEFKRRLLPQPWSVIAHGFTEKGNPKNPGELLNALQLTARVSITGFAIAALIGVAVAVLMSQQRWVENSIYPYALALQTIPIIAIAPVIGAIFGYNIGARTLVCVMISVVPMIVNTLFGLKSADQGQHDLFELHGASRLTRLRKLQLPAALPAMFEGFRISAGLAVIGAIVGEFFFQQGPRGLGNLVFLYRTRGWYEQLYADLILCTALGLAVFLVITTVRKLAIGRWHVETGQ